MRLSRPFQPPFQAVRLICSALVVLAVTLALSGLSFAHRAPSVADRLLVAYALVAADAGDLCETGGPDKARGDCPACRLGGTTLLPTPVTPAQPFACQVQRKPALAETAAPRPRVRDPAHGLRAPPAVPVA